MPGSARDFGSHCVARQLVAAGVLGVTNAGTVVVDMGLSRQGWLVINQVLVTDVPTAVILQHSPDNATWTALRTVANADVAASAFLQYDLANMQRYLRLTWTRALANGDSFWAVSAIGDLLRRAPVGT